MTSNQENQRIDDKVTAKVTADLNQSQKINGQIAHNIPYRPIIRPRERTVSLNINVNHNRHNSGSTFMSTSTSAASSSSSSSNQSQTQNQNFTQNQRTRTISVGSTSSESAILTDQYEIVDKMRLVRVSSGSFNGEKMSFEWEQRDRRRWY